MDFSNGRYIAKDASGQTIGVIDHDEYICSGTKLLYKVEEDEVYTAAKEQELVGFIVGNVASSLNGDVLFTLHADN